MKYKIPEENQAQFNTLLRSLPLTLQEDESFKETLLVHLKLGGIGLARYMAQTTAKYLDVDVLEIGTGLRFPKVVEVKQEETEGDDDEKDDDDDSEQDGEAEDDDDDGSSAE